jgi:hypothetical protein
MLTSPFFDKQRTNADAAGALPDDTVLEDADDLQQCVYYFETLLNVFRWCTNDVWAMMSTETIGEEDQMDRDFLRACKPCIVF